MDVLLRGNTRMYVRNVAYLQVKEILNDREMRLGEAVPAEIAEVNGCGRTDDRRLVWRPYCSPPTKGPGGAIDAVFSSPKR